MKKTTIFVTGCILSIAAAVSFGRSLPYLDGSFDGGSVKITNEVNTVTLGPITVSSPTSISANTVTVYRVVNTNTVQNGNIGAKTNILASGGASAFESFVWFPDGSEVRWSKRDEMVITASQTNELFYIIDRGAE